MTALGGTVDDPSYDPLGFGGSVAITGTDARAVIGYRHERLHPH